MSQSIEPLPDCPRCVEGIVQVRSRVGFACAELQDAPDCDVAGCDGEGSVLVRDEHGRRSLSRCRWSDLGRSVEHFNHAAIPARHADSTLVGFDKDLEGVTEAFIRAFSWTESFDPGRENRGLVLHGQVGRGKTHLMVAMIRELTLRKGTAVRFIEVTELLSQLREAFSERRSTSSLLHSVSNVSVLAIDELGKGGRTDWQMSVIDEVISRRYNTMGTILATTNYPPGPPTGAGSVNLADEASLQRQTLGDRIGARAYSRLREVCDFVEMRGADYRERPRNG